MQNRGEVAESIRNPWSALPVHSKDAPRLERRPYSEEEALAFINAVDARAKDHPSDPLIVRLMACTGARIEEICSLRSASVQLESSVAWVKIEGGKTKSAKRRLPIVAPEVVVELRSRTSKSNGQVPLFSDLRANKYGRAGQLVSNRLGRVVRSISDDPALVAAHSWRHRGRTLAERAGIIPSTADWFFGHARPGEGLGRYSQGPSDDQLIAVAKAVPLPS
jgi:integrase